MLLRCITIEKASGGSVKVAEEAVRQLVVEQKDEEETIGFVSF